MKAHPAAELFPMMSEEELSALATNIAEQGLLRPIERFGDLILDGRNRYAACERAGVEPTFVDVNPTDPIAYIISANIHRRHLTTAQRAAIAAELANLGRGGDRGNQYTGGKGPNDPLPDDTPISIEQAAELMNVSPRSVKRAKKTMHNDPKKHEAVKRGEKPAKRKATPKKVSTVNIYYEEGAISSPKSGQKTQQLNEEVERLAPGAIGAGDERRIREAVRAIVANKETVAKARVEEQKQREKLVTPKEESNLDRAIRVAVRRVELEAEIKIEARVTAWLNEVLPRYNEEYQYYKSSNDSYKGVMSFEQYKDLEGFLHPDRHPNNQARASRLFALVREHKFLLCGERPEHLKNGPGSLPTTVEELIAQRRNKH